MEFRIAFKSQPMKENLTPKNKCKYPENEMYSSRLMYNIPYESEQEIYKWRCSQHEIMSFSMTCVQPFSWKWNLYMYHVHIFGWKYFLIQ